MDWFNINGEFYEAGEAELPSDAADIIAYKIFDVLREKGYTTSPLARYTGPGFSDSARWFSYHRKGREGCAIVVVMRNDYQSEFGDIKVIGQLVLTFHEVEL